MMGMRSTLVLSALLSLVATSACGGGGGGGGASGGGAGGGGSTPAPLVVDAAAEAALVGTWPIVAMRERSPGLSEWSSVEALAGSELALTSAHTAYLRRLRSTGPEYESWNSWHASTTEIELIDPTGVVSRWSFVLSGGGDHLVVSRIRVVTRPFLTVWVDQEIECAR